MAALCGKSSYVMIGSCTPVTTTDWTLTYGSEPQEYTPVGGNGAALTCAGVERGSGTINVVTDPLAIVASVSASGALVFITCVAENGGDVAAGFARIGQIESSGEIGGGVQTQTYPFTCHGKWGGTLLGVSTTLDPATYTS